MRQRFARLFRRRDPTDALLGEEVAELRAVLNDLVAISYRAGAEAHRFDEIASNTYSSSGEDGILDHILEAIGPGTGRCVDIGAGSAEGSNVAALIVEHGYHALLIDAGAAGLEQGAAFYRASSAAHQPEMVTARVTAENVNELLQEHGFTGEIDVLSIDLDGVDYWVWKAVEAVEPRVLVAEYQDILGPDRSWTVPYRPDFAATDYDVNARLNNYCGASLRAFTDLSASKGLRLVGCSPGGWNAFFVKSGLAADELPEATVASCFRFAWNEYGMSERFPLVADMEWQEV